MYSFRELKKASKLNIENGTNPKIQLVVIGNTATQFFSMAVQGQGRSEGIDLSVLDCDYNQIDSQLIDPTSEAFAVEPDYILLWLASEKLYEEFLDLAPEERTSFADDYGRKLENWCDLIRRNGHGRKPIRIMIPNLVEIDDKALGQYSAKCRGTFIYQLRRLNDHIQEYAADSRDVYPVDLSAIQNRIGRQQFHDSVLYYNAKMAIALNSLPYVAEAVVDVIRSASGRIKKCVILDLDNTLWGGVIGDDGVGGIEIGELGRGHAFTNLQRWLKQLKQCGIILAVCSKNEEDIAREPFEKNDEMILRLQDISIFVANWNDKASNIRMIQKSLNIGMDSIVFLDDNPYEREQVRQAIPDITVPELPEDPADYLDFLQRENLFDTVSYSSESADRTEQYREEFERQKLQVSFESIDDYLISLNMVGEVREFSPDRYPRIAQLTQRSNQFNLRTVRYTEEEIQAVSEAEDRIGLYYTLKDKFGDYGLVSVVILDLNSSETAFVDTWLMSCRVLKRGMEEFIMNGIMKVVSQRGIRELTAEYIPTAKNKMVAGIYDDMGWQLTEQSDEGIKRYSISVTDYKIKSVHIEEV